MINYRVKHNQKFNESFVKDLKLNMPDMVYIYSQNSAQSFLSFVKNHQFESLWMNTNLSCIGEKTLWNCLIIFLKYFYRYGTKVF